MQAQRQLTRANGYLATCITSMLYDRQTRGAGVASFPACGWSLSACEDASLFDSDAPQLFLCVAGPRGARSEHLLRCDTNWPTVNYLGTHANAGCRCADMTICLCPSCRCASMKEVCAPVFTGPRIYIYIYNLYIYNLNIYIYIIYIYIYVAQRPWRL